MRTLLSYLLVLSLVSLGSRSKKLKLMMLENDPDFGISAGGESHPCYRPCDGTPMECRFNFTLSVYSTFSVSCGDCPRTPADCSLPGCVSAAGTSRPIYVANLMLPGPGIHVCEGDSVVVRVENAFPIEGATVHWHGVWMRSRQHMDGVPYVSQCPIPPNNVFEYSFVAFPAGTHMWHSHIGFLEADGLFGPLVIRRPASSDSHRGLYDEDLVEHTVMLWHWYPHLSGDYLPLRLFRNESVSGVGLLVNGKGRIAQREGYDAPYEYLHVRQGKRYRFRFISNSAVFCPVQLSIDNHTMIAIASDGADFEPVEVDSLMLNAGERWDVVVNANQAVARYWIRLRALGDCGEGKGRVSQQAVLVYDSDDVDDVRAQDVAQQPPGDRPTYDTSRREGRLLNPMQVVATDYELSGNEVVRVSDLENIDKSIHGNISGPADHTLYVALDFKSSETLSVPGPYPQNNGISFEYPPVPMILQRYEKAPGPKGPSWCSREDAHEHCLGDYCSCTYTESIPLGALVEIVLIDLSLDRAMDHPYHIHGTNFHLVAEATVGNQVSLALVRALNEGGALVKRLDKSAPLKDTVTVPSRGYAVVRFRALNPGFWFFHCHISNHVHLGMAMVLKVGNESDMEPVPQDFPRCGDWTYSGTSGVEPEEPGKDSGAVARAPLLTVLVLCLLSVFDLLESGRI